MANDNEAISYYLQVVHLPLRYIWGSLRFARDDERSISLLSLYVIASGTKLSPNISYAVNLHKVAACLICGVALGCARAMAFIVLIFYAPDRQANTLTIVTSAYSTQTITYCA